MFDLVSVGEALVDFTPAGKSEEGRPLYERNAGGAALNLAVVAAKMGAETAFIGKVGADSMGRYVIETAAENGVDVSGVVYDPDLYTTLAFVTLSDDGERDFSFARKPGADTALLPNELPKRILRRARMVHFGSLALNSNPTRDTIINLVCQAADEGSIITFDANYRRFLWDSEAYYRARSLLAISHSDVIKVSEEEAAILTGVGDCETQAKQLRHWGPSLVCLTLGAKGCYIQTKEGGFMSSAYSAGPVVDTTGAGDCFFGAFLSQLIKVHQPLEASLVSLKDMARFANAAAGLCVTRRGGIPSIPDKPSVTALVMK